MPTRLTLFVSSTVRDFGPVRRDIAEWLKTRSIDVRESEDPEFPVDPAVHSHDACLRAIEGCQVFVLLIGWRYGGLYRRTLQSITWREYDEARRLGVPVVVFIHKEVNDEAMRLAQARKQLSAYPSPLDPGVVRFIDAVRKPSTDNWVYGDWDGSFSHVRKVLQARLNTLFVNYQRPHRSLERQAQRTEPYAHARMYVDTFVLRAYAEMTQLGATPERKRKGTDELLDMLVRFKTELFDFSDDDRHNFAIYKRDQGELAVFARRHHKAIDAHNRPWPLGIGHIGLSGETGDILVAPNLQHTKYWRGEYPSDEKNYVSCICCPIPSRVGRSDPAGVLAITSSRGEHFRSQQQVEVLTAKSLAAIISLMGVLDG